MNWENEKSIKINKSATGLKNFKKEYLGEFDAKTQLMRERIQRESTRRASLVDKELDFIFRSIFGENYTIEHIKEDIKHRCIMKHFEGDDVQEFSIDGVKMFVVYNQYTLTKPFKLQKLTFCEDEKTTGADTKSTLLP